MKTRKTITVIIVALAGLFVLWDQVISYKAATRRFLNEVKTNLNPEELVAWANDEIRKPHDNAMIRQEALPKSVTDAWPGSSKAQWGLLNNSNVCIVWGGGFGHWGLKIGDPSTYLNDGTYNIMWTTNIYVWHQTQ